MSVFAIILLIVLGIALIIIEFLVIPGITIAGIGGAVILIGSIYLSYRFHGNQTGNYILIGTILGSVVAIYFSLRAVTWQNVGLTSNIEGKFEAFEKEKIKVGDQGKTITRLAPIGKALVNDIICEARSPMQFIDEGTEIEVIKINNNQIIVKPKNKT